MSVLRWITYTVGVLIALAVIVFLVFKFSPWPSALMVRSSFDKGGIEANRKLEKHVPPGIVAFTNLAYRSHPKLLLDLYRPANAKTAGRPKYPVIVWVHGGGLISGSKDQVANYCKIIAGKGYAVAAINYTVAPEAKYPTPILQTQAALKYLLNNAGKYGLDTSMFILAGDSGGAMIAATTAATIYDPAYSKLTRVRAELKPGQLKGLALFCGIYDVSNLNLQGPFGSFMRTVLWSYFGKKDIAADWYAQTASVLNYVNEKFPPAFISAGNIDPLLPQSVQLAKKLSTAGVKTQTLFFPINHKPGLAHEYQFNLDTPEGRLALKECLGFLYAVTK